MQPRTPFPTAAAAQFVLASPALLAARGPSGQQGGRTAGVPTTTVVEDDFLTLFPSGDATQDGFVARDDDDLQGSIS